MNNSIKQGNACTLTARLSLIQFQHIKSQAKPSEYLRMLIDQDLILAVNHVKA